MTFKCDCKPVLERHWKRWIHCQPIKDNHKAKGNSVCKTAIGYYLTDILVVPKHWPSFTLIKYQFLLHKTKCISPGQPMNPYSLYAPFKIVDLFKDREVYIYEHS